MVGRLQTERARTALLLVALLVCILGLDLWQRVARAHGKVAPLDSAVCALSLPLQRGLVAGADFFDAEWMAIVRARDLIGENANLSARIAFLERSLSQVEEQRSEEQRQAALDQAYPARLNGALAHVIGLGDGGWSSAFTLDRGAADAIRVQDVAVSPEGVVGQIYAISGHTCRLLPITDPASSVAVRLQRSRDTGILKGIGDWACEIHYLDPEADVRAGDAVITSGLGGIFPQGLRVGTVLALREDADTPGKVAEVEPAAPLRKLEDVMLLRASPGATAP
jgi:rod shape-determining protein MreC